MGTLLVSSPECFLLGFDVEFVLVDKGEGEVIPVPHVSEDRQVHF